MTAVDFDKACPVIIAVAISEISWEKPGEDSIWLFSVAADVPGGSAPIANLTKATAVDVVLTFTALDPVTMLAAII